MEINNDKSHEKIKLQLENLNISIVNHFNNDNPFFIKDANGNERQVKVIYNVGETWQQIEEIEKKQARGDYIIQKPIITLKSVGIEPIKEWNRLSIHNILLDKQTYINPYINNRDKGPANTHPVFEYTIMKYPIHYRRRYRMSFWTDYLIDQDNIIETVMATLMSSNTILITNDEYNTIGKLSEIVDENNFDDRSENLRELKNYIDFEFEGYLIHPNSIKKKRSYSHIKISEEIVKK